MKGKILFGCVALVMLFAFANCGHLPGHGKVEKQNLQEAVIDHVSSTLTSGETVEYLGNSGNDYIKVDGEPCFSTNVSYYVVSSDGSKVKHTAHVVTNDDRDKIIEWKDM